MPAFDAQAAIGEVPPTFELLPELHRKFGVGRHPALREDQAQAAAVGLQAQLRLPASHRERLLDTVKALNVFLHAFNDAGRVAIYGPELARSLCHALFGADLRLTIFAGPEQARRILLVGETGAGKEAVAEVTAQTLLALEGGRGVYRPVNAAALADSLADSELFGHLRGSFTGAVRDTEGIIGSLGEGGVLFLDELGEASPGIQARLLRVIQSGEYKVVGSSDGVAGRFHVVAATNRSKPSMQAGEGLRADLYYRLARPVVLLPPLRALLTTPERAQAVLGRLVDHVLRSSVLRRERADVELGWVESWRKDLVRELAERTSTYSWPGNLRECTGFIEEVLYQGREALPALCDGLVGATSGGRGRRHSGDGKMSLHQALAAEEHRLLEEAARGAHTLEELAGHLGITRQTASRRLTHFGLKLGHRK